MVRTDLRLRLFVAVVVTVAVAAAVASVQALPFGLSPLVLALAAAAMAADVMTVDLSSLRVSMQYPILSAVAVLFGPAVTGVVAALSSVPSGLIVKDKQLLRALFNAGQLSISFLAGAWAYVIAGGRILGNTPLSIDEIPRMIIPLTMLAASSFLLNMTLVAVVIALDTGTPLGSVLKSSFAWTIPTQVALTVLAVALAEVVAAEGVPGLGLFVVPLLIARQFYERYVALKNTYADMVRSLVAVIEEKDAYTRGHSERVAAYSIGLATRLGLDERKLERIELAALLHDLGKVGVSKGILSAPRRLEPNEFAVIQTHPGIGADIIGTVPFLADLVPWVLGHHERLDGRGYAQHLAGDEIPFEARVLCVADAFDAMTSSRPYRPPLTLEASIAELLGGCDTQFDKRVVEVFVQGLEEGDFDEVLDQARQTG